jgi:hypothetical protein
MAVRSPSPKPEWLGCFRAGAALTPELSFQRPDANFPMPVKKGTLGLLMLLMGTSFIIHYLEL